MTRHFLFSALIALAAASAHAQSTAGSYASLDYSFGVDTGNASDLTVNDDGEVVYNLVIPRPQPGFDSPYTVMTGTGDAFAQVDNAYYDDSSTSGHNGVSSRANSGAMGTATASVGSQENLRLTNNGLDTITVSVTALAQCVGDASVTGTPDGGNLASVDTYVGIYDLNTTTHVGVNPLIHVSGTAADGVTTTYTSDWTPIDFNGLPYYEGSYTVTLLAGETHALEFYTSSENVAAVPEPASIAALGLGAFGFLRRRRKS